MKYREVSMKKAAEKKGGQLGMNPSTAAHRLRMDLLFNFVVAAGHKCHRCGGELTRETFSIEHKTPWLDSQEPVRLFFDTNNVAFSHAQCNFGARRDREPQELLHGTYYGYTHGRCRCERCRSAAREQQRLTRLAGRTAADRNNTGVNPPPDTR